MLLKIFLLHYLMLCVYIMHACASCHINGSQLSPTYCVVLEFTSVVRLGKKQVLLLTEPSRQPQLVIVKKGHSEVQKLSVG